MPRSTPVAVDTESGKRFHCTIHEANELLDAGEARVVSQDPLILRLIPRAERDRKAETFDHERRRQSGRRMEGVTRFRFNGRLSHSNPNRIVFPPRFEDRDQELHRKLNKENRNWQEWKRKLALASMTDPGLLVIGVEKHVRPKKQRGPQGIRGIRPVSALPGPGEEKPASTA